MKNNQYKVRASWVKLSTAQLLKDAGFYYKGKCCYKHKGLYVPEQSIVVKWFRQLFNYVIQVEYDQSSDRFHWHIFEAFDPLKWDRFDGKKSFKTHEAATEDAIIYCLKKLLPLLQAEPLLKIDMDALKELKEWNGDAWINYMNDDKLIFVDTTDEQPSQSS